MRIAPRHVKELVDNHLAVKYVHPRVEIIVLVVAKVLVRGLQRGLVANVLIIVRILVLVHVKNHAPRLVG